MRKVFEYPTFLEVGHLASLLESHGIPSVVKNQDVSSLMGEVPFLSAFPELWVVDEGDYDRAVALVQEYRSELSDDSNPEDWLCPACGESVPGSFGSCWNCDSTRSSD